MYAHRSGLGENESLLFKVGEGEDTTDTASNERFAYVLDELGCQVQPGMEVTGD